ncbi:MAG: GTP-binding protein, partial [Erysipelotrichaceae bacterium]|nr:GTP-binding protein [Erysipelotrichaceae bacterium]
EIINVIRADDDFRIVSHICIVDVKTCRKYHQNFGEYFNDQVKAANAIILSHVDVADEKKIEEARELVRELNEEAEILDSPITEYPIEELLDVIVNGGDILPEFEEEDEDEDEHDHDHEHEHEHEHHHHHHHNHHHHGEDDDDDEDEIFKNQIIRPEHVFTEEELAAALTNVDGDIIRIKGYVHGEKGTLYFNYVLNEYHIYYGEEREDSLVSVIGTAIDEDRMKEVFHG